MGMGTGWQRVSFTFKFFEGGLHGCFLRTEALSDGIPNPQHHAFMKLSCFGCMRRLMAAPKFFRMLGLLARFKSWQKKPLSNFS